MNKHPHIPMSAPAKPSSQIEHYGYDAATKTLAVKFHRGAEYRYAGVPQETFDAMGKADSVGSYFAKNVKGTHDAVKIEQPKESA